MKLKIQIAISFVVCVLMTSSAFSQPETEIGMRRRMGEGQCSRASELKLSEEQRGTLGFLQQRYLREAQILRLEILTKKIQLRDLLTDPAVKVESIRGKSSEIAELQSKQEEKAIDYLVKVRNLLSSEQLKTWCPDQEFPYIRQMIPGRRPMGMFPK